MQQNDSRSIPRWNIPAAQGQLFIGCDRDVLISCPKIRRGLATHSEALRVCKSIAQNNGIGNKLEETESDEATNQGKDTQVKPVSTTASPLSWQFHRLLIDPFAYTLCAVTLASPIPSSSVLVANAMSITALSKASWLARDGLRYPLILRTYCSAASLISSSVAGCSLCRSCLILLHINHSTCSKIIIAIHRRNQEPLLSRIAASMFAPSR